MWKFHIGSEWHLYEMCYLRRDERLFVIAPDKLPVNWGLAKRQPLFFGLT
jgi:hypothetical protein